MTGNDLEQLAPTWFHDAGWEYCYGPDIAPGASMVNRSFAMAAGFQPPPLPSQNLPTPDQAFGEGDAMSGAQSPPSAPSSGHNAPSSGHNDRLQSNSTRHEDGYLLVKGLNKPLIDNLKLLPEALRQQLMSVAEKARAKQRLAPDEMTPILLRLCENAYLTQQVLAELVNRMPEALRKNNLKPLVDKGSLALAFPTVPTHPQQAYTSNKGRGDD